MSSRRKKSAPKGDKYANLSLVAQNGPSGPAAVQKRAEIRQKKLVDRSQDKGQVATIQIPEDHRIAERLIIAIFGDVAMREKIANDERGVRMDDDSYDLPCEIVGICHTCHSAGCRYCEPSAYDEQNRVY